MAGCSHALDEDDDLAKLMPNMAKLIRLGRSNSLESKGSTSMSISGNGVKDNLEDLKLSRHGQGESVFRDVANKFLRRGATGKRSVVISKASAVATLSSNCRVGSSSAERWRNAHVLEKENVRPNAPTLVKQSAQSILQQKMVMKDTSQKFAKKFRKLPSRSEGSSYFSVNSKIQRAEKSNTISVSEHLAQPGATVASPKAPRSSRGPEDFSNLAGKSQSRKTKLYRTTMSLNLSELKEEFAEIDEEALEEEEVSIAHMTKIGPVVASEALLHHADDILQSSMENRKVFSRSEREEVVNDTLNGKIEEAVLPIYLHRHVQEGVVICTSQSMSSKTPGQAQDVHVFEPTGKANNAVLSSGHDRYAISCLMRLLSPSERLDLDDGNQGDNVKCRNEEKQPRIEQDSANPFLKGLDDQASGRTADTKTTPCQLEVFSLEVNSAQMLKHFPIELDNAEDSCNHRRGYSPTEPNVDKLKVTITDGPEENAAHREDSVPRHSLTQSVAKQLPKQDDVPDIPLQGGTFSTGDTSATPPRLHCSRRGRSFGMNQRRLAFDSGSDSKQKAVARAVESDSSDASVSTAKFKGRTNSAAGIINHDGHDLDANMTDLPDQEAKISLVDEEVIGQVNDRDCVSHSSKSKAATHIEGVDDREKLLMGSLAEDGNRPAFEASGEIGKDPYCFNSRSHQVGLPTDCPEIRGLGKRTWANLGAPIDGGTKWKEGRRVSTRIKSRPLDWWRGERMLYGRVHSSIKTTSPDPVWPRPKPQRGDYTVRNFHVASFVDDSHCELLRLAAQ